MIDLAREFDEAMESNEAYQTRCTARVAVELLRRHQWSGGNSQVRRCPDCGARKPHHLEERCEIAALLNRR